MVMKRDDFIKLILANITIGEVFQNPGGGTSTIKRFDNEKIVYQRGNIQKLRSFQQSQVSLPFLKSNYMNQAQLIFGRQCVAKISFN